MLRRQAGPSIRPCHRRRSARSPPQRDWLRARSPPLGIGGRRRRTSRNTRRVEGFSAFGSEPIQVVDDCVSTRRGIHLLRHRFDNVREDLCATAFWSARLLGSSCLAPRPPSSFITAARPRGGLRARKLRGSIRVVPLPRPADRQKPIPYRSRSGPCPRVSIS